MRDEERLHTVYSYSDWEPSSLFYITYLCLWHNVSLGARWNLATYIDLWVLLELKNNLIPLAKSRKLRINFRRFPREICRNQGLDFLSQTKIFLWKFRRNHFICWNLDSKYVCPTTINDPYFDRRQVVYLI